MITFDINCSTNQSLEIGALTLIRGVITAGNFMLIVATSILIRGHNYVTTVRLGWAETVVGWAVRGARSRVIDDGTKHVHIIDQIKFYTRSVTA